LRKSGFSTWEPNPELKTGRRRAVYTVVEDNTEESRDDSKRAF
jgi:hypothetical protein